ncbi:MAG TPA: hypothetical protein VFB38_08185 [Chthonomonadaceae bacterium]|nr:hypothetical protein [Chthonomonadaceae bacterium]
MRRLESEPAHAYPTWRIHLFGGLHAQNGNLPLTRFKTQKVAGLLAYLVYYLPRSIPVKF